MIFVTVGTHEQQFDRLVKAMDWLKGSGTVAEEVVIQTGFSTYEPKYCVWQKMYPYQQMCRFVEEARIVITHGGPSSFMMPLQLGKTPIVVPRQKRFGEHVNDHQVSFCKAVEERMGTIITVTDISALPDIILRYDALAEGRRHGHNGNNESFNAHFTRIAEELTAGRDWKACASRK